ncbi:MAG: helix-turn-helix transcriptional regulator [Clostridium sp.]|nr:helix-turn-helix transcriptional regulator [Clostridium sp.]
MSDMKKLLGKKIKQFRKSKNLTQEELAEKINIEVPSLSNIETGKFAPSFDTLQKLSSILNIELWEFYYFNPVSNEKMIEEINIKIKNNENLTKIVYNFIKSIEQLG